MASQTLEQRVDSLENILATFITTTGNALTRLEKEMREFKDEMREFKDEMREFKDEMRAFKQEMLEFKDEMREFKQEMREYRDKTDQMIARMDKESIEFKQEMKEFKDRIDKSIDELNKKFGDMTRRMGTIVEDLVFPAVPIQLRRKFKVTLSFFGIRIKRTIKINDFEEKNKEFDAYGISLDQSTIYLCYVKTTLRDKDLNLFYKEVEDFREFFPEYKGRKLVGILASMNYSKELLALYEQEGLIYMAPSGYALEIKNEINNETGFQPKLWEI